MKPSGIIATDMVYDAQTDARQFNQPARKVCSQVLHLDGIPPKLNALSVGSHSVKMIL
jgi:hypothetical protein